MSNDGMVQVMVAGAPGLAAALDESGRFGAVHACDSTGQLRGLIAQGLLGQVTQETLVFVFADTVLDDTPGTPLAAVIGKLTTTGWRVAILETSPAGRDLVAAHPGAGLIPGPHSTNAVLGALSGFGLGLIEPVDERWAATPLPVFDPAALATVRGLELDLAASPFTAPPRAPQDQHPAWDVPAEPAPVAPWAPPAGPAWDEEVAVPAPWSPTEAPPWEPPAPVTTWAPDAVPTAWGQPAPAWEPPAAAEPVWDPPTASAPWNETADPWGALPPPAAPAGWAAPAPETAWPTAPPPSGWAGPEAPVEYPPLADPSLWQASGPAITTYYQAPAPGAAALSGHPSGPPPRRGLITAVTVPKGGAGKSSLTLNLGAYLGLRLRSLGRTVCVVDANYQQADIGKLLNAYTPNIASVVRSMEDLTPERIGRHLLHRPDLNVSFLLGPATTEEANPLWITPELYAQCVEVLKQLYDYVIIDTPVAEFHHELFGNFVLPCADFILVPVAPNFPTIMNTDQWLRAVTTPKHAGGAGYDEQRIGIVLNRAEEDIGCSEQEVVAELANWQFLGAIPESREWRRAANQDEIVATKNYVELNAAFAKILYAITGESTLVAGPAEEEIGSAKAKRGLAGRFGRKR